MSDQATVVSEVALPVEVVTLKHLKTRSGEPVRVLIENRDHMRFYDATKTLPGFGPRDTTAEEAVAQDPALAEEMVRQNLAFAEPLIELCTVLVDEQGREVIPAFWFDPAKPRHPQSLPGRVLHEEDKVEMLNAILRVGGFLGGPAAEVSFPAGVGGGPADGGGAPGAVAGPGGASA
jgi:hypothetical protein